MRSQTACLVAEGPPWAHVLGVPVHVIGVEEAIQSMEEWIQRGDRGRWIAVTGSHGIIEGHKYPEFKRILKSADLSLPDGKWAAWLAGHLASRRPKQVRGADLVWNFCHRASQKGYRNFFYGDTGEVLALLVRRLQERFPTLTVAGTYSPPFRPLTPEEDEEITARIKQANPDVLWVGLGLPKQERWIVEHRDKLAVPILVAAGAAFKFVGGKVKPAPQWISDWGLEWVWRFVREPRRLWHRVMVYGPQFLAHALLELGGLRKYH